MSIVDKILQTRLVHAVKTKAQWEEVDSTTGDPKYYPVQGEVCLELQNNGSYKIKIGDGTNAYINLPYFGDFSTLNGSAAVARVVTNQDSTKSLEFYGITESNGVVSLGTLLLTVKGGDKITLDNTTGTTVNIKHDAKSETSGKTYDSPAEESLTDSGTFKVATKTDSTGHVSEWTEFTLPSIGTAISTALALLDSSVSTTSNVKVLTGVTEVDGLLNSKTETEIVGGTKLNVVGAAGSITVNHDTQTQTNTDNSSVVGEKELDVITGVNVDSTGHVTGVVKDKSTNMVAADIKAPVKMLNNDTWNFRPTGGTINIGEDKASIPELKGNTLVWNQLIQNGDFSSTTNTTWYPFNTDITISIANNTLTLTKATSSSIPAVALYNSTKLTINTSHRYFITAIAKVNYTPTEDSKASLYFITTGYSSGTNDVLMFDSTSFERKSMITSPSNSTDRLCIRCINNSGSANSSADFKNIFVIDLTKLLGSDAEICSALGVSNLTDSANLTLAAENFEKLFPNPYYSYCEGRPVNVGGYGVKWNQLVGYETSSVTLTSTHKFYKKISGTASVVTGDGSSQVTTGGTDMVCDLTLMFGAGNEPSTVEEFEAMFPEDYYEYNPGTDVNIMEQMGKNLEIESVGFNQWDEQWENGAIRGSNGTNDDSVTDTIRSKNYIPVFPNTVYFVKSATTLGCRRRFYDANKQYIGEGSSIETNTNQVFTTPVGAYFMRFYMVAAYGTTYNHDICINLSDSSRNGTYLPYKKDTLDLGWINKVDIEWNLWDEEYGTGRINPADGETLQPSSPGIYSLNFIPVIGGEYYYGRYPYTESSLVILEYDTNKNHLNTYQVATNTAIQLSSSTAYIKFYTTLGSDNICINKSIPAFNGTYLPYGERLKVFGEGLCGKEGWNDWARGNKVGKRVRSQRVTGSANDTVTLVGCNTSATSYICNLGNIGTLSSGVLTLSETVTDAIIYYPLATPFELDLEEKHKMDYFVDDLGTERQTPDNGSMPVTSPFVGTFQYESNFKDTVIDLINRVNAYANPVKGKDNTNQEEGMFAIYDSKESVKSSPYSVADNIVVGAANNLYLLPSVAALITYVQSVLTSALTYKGTIALVTDIPTTGQSNGDLLAANDDITIDSTAAATYHIAEGTLYTGSFIIWNAATDEWDIIPSNITVVLPASVPELKPDGTTTTIVTIGGQAVQVKMKNIDVSDPTASGTADNLQVLTNISQTDGEISATKKTLPDASTSQKGVTQFIADVHNATSSDTNKVVNAKQVKDEMDKRNVKAVEISTVQGGIVVFPHTIVATTDPSAAPQFVGQIYTNTSSGKAWFGLGTSSVSDWAQLSFVVES